MLLMKPRAWMFCVHGRYPGAKRKKRWRSIELCIVTLETWSQGNQLKANKNHWIKYYQEQLPKAIGYPVEFSICGDFWHPQTCSARFYKLPTSWNSFWPTSLLLSPKEKSHPSAAPSISCPGFGAQWHPSLDAMYVGSADCDFRAQ